MNYMLNDYYDCVFQYVSHQSWVTPLAQTISALAGVATLFVAWRNLRGLRRAQMIQAQVNLIDLETKARTYYVAYRETVQSYADNKDPAKVQVLNIKAAGALEIYIATVNRLAALIDSDFLTGQFDGRDWKSEYDEIFKQALQYYNDDTMIFPGKSALASDLTRLVGRWNSGQ